MSVFGPKIATYGIAKVIGSPVTCLQFYWRQANASICVAVSASPLRLHGNVHRLLYLAVLTQAQARKNRCQKKPRKSMSRQREVIR
eukprot:5823097-Pleurochrysis_carterae.AAC.4